MFCHTFLMLSLATGGYDPDQCRNCGLLCIEPDALGLVFRDYSLHFLRVYVESNACHSTGLQCQLPLGRDLQPQVSQVSDSLLPKALSHPCLLLENKPALQCQHQRGSVNENHWYSWTLTLSIDSDKDNSSTCLIPAQHLHCYYHPHCARTAQKLESSAVGWPRSLTLIHA